LRKYLTPFRVGLLVLAAATFTTIFFTFAKKGGLSAGESLKVFAYFRDASGLSKKSRVQIAGISVGEITDISLEGGKAKVSLKVRRDVNLRQDAALTKRSESLLGDFVLDLYPGSDAAPPMPDGGEIKKVIDSQGVETVFNALGRITADIQAVTGSLREVFGSEKGEGALQRIVDNLVKLSETFDTSVSGSAEKLDSILRNFETISSQVRSLTTGEEGAVREIVANIQNITRDVREVVGSLKQAVGTPADGGADGAAMANARQMIDHLDSSLSNLEQITKRINEGQGTIGALVSDETLGRKIKETVEDVSDYASKLTRLQIEVGIKSEYLVSQGSSKQSLGIKLIPRPDKYYLIELVDDPRGFVSTDIIQRNPPGTEEPATQVQRITRSQLKFSAEFAKRYYFATLRFGIIESSGGVGADLHFFNDSLTIRTDAFNFASQDLRYPRVRTAIRLQAFQHLFATIGVDDILNRQVRDVLTNNLIAGRDFFFGGGVFFTDDDLKAILSAAPSIRP
jgi:phospholipid/cholesterol/gamma-HCH transport system substrate-binding protein